MCSPCSILKLCRLKCIIVAGAGRLHVPSCVPARLQCRPQGSSAARKDACRRTCWNDRPTRSCKQISEGNNFECRSHKSLLLPAGYAGVTGKVSRASSLEHSLEAQDLLGIAQELLQCVSIKQMAGLARRRLHIGRDIVRASSCGEGAVMVRWCPMVRESHKHRSLRCSCGAAPSCHTRVMQGRRTSR